MTLAKTEFIAISMGMTSSAVLRTGSCTRSTCHCTTSIPPVTGAYLILPAELTFTCPVCGFIVMFCTSYTLVLTRAKAGLTMSITCSIILFTARTSPVFITDTFVSFSCDLFFSMWTTIYTVVEIRPRTCGARRPTLSLVRIAISLSKLVI